jgi:hypothetical protein
MLAIYDVESKQIVVGMGAVEVAKVGYKNTVAKHTSSTKSGTSAHYHVSSAYVWELCTKVHNLNQLNITNMMTYAFKNRNDDLQWRCIIVVFFKIVFMLMGK